MAFQCVKVVCLGDNGIGKTSLLISYTLNYFPGPDQYLPNALDSSSSFVSCDGLPLNLSLYDVYYTEEFTRMRVLSYPQTDVFLLGFSVDNRYYLYKLFDLLIHFKELIRRYFN
jgi:GTPase SAR1 family protein